MTNLILCANCRREQPDSGKRATCEFCGCFPLPSFAYSKNSSFHPSRCRGSRQTAPAIPFRTRKTSSSLRLGG